jgi:signal transduction histidine kinase/ActR/RegA family two-component response regulator
MTAEALTGSDYRVLLLPLTRRDGEVTREVLQHAGISCAICPEPSDFEREVRAGAGAVILSDTLAEEADSTRVLQALGQQWTWSDIPTILLSRTDRRSKASTQMTAALTNVTILDRPTSPRTLVSAVRAALRGRRRQYELRDQLQALREADEAMRAADRLKDEFLAMLGHELRNPLAPICTAVEVLLRQLPDDSPALAAIKIVERQTNHLTRLVDDLLDVSRITQGRIRLHRLPVPVDSVVTQAVESIAPLLREKGHRVAVEQAPSPLWVDGDSARLVQCLTNLLHNAAKYTDPGGNIRVEIRAGADTVVIVVTDDGIGISPELLPRIFDLFVQSDRALDRSEGGLGIGLSVVHRLIEMHGGSVTVASTRIGGGSSFEVRLPRIAPPPVTAPQACRCPPATAKKMLVVDDNVDAASSLAEVLVLDGHVAEAVFTARGALHQAAASAPDIVLLDIGLPEMDGYQVARALRALSSSVRLVALTGYGQAEDVQRALAAGFDAHLVKPVDFATLRRIIAEIPDTVGGGGETVRPLHGSLSAD